MVAFNPLGVITDPDQLSATVKLTSETLAAGDEVFIDTTTKTIQLAVDGNLTTDGLTLKCLYSFLKDRWKDNSNLIKFPFPMTPITDEQFEFFNGWNLDKVTTTGAASQTSPQLIRTGGWAVKNASGVDTERWACVISLGSLGTTDQVYYSQIDTLATDETANFVLTNTVNQAVQYYRDDDGDGNTAEGSDYDYSSFLKVYVREWEKTYASAALTDIGVTSLNYQAYRFPLTNTSDSKIVNLGISEKAASGTSVTITGATWSGGTATYTSNGHGFIVGDVLDISGITPSGYNGTYTVTAAATNTFGVAIASDPGSYSSGGTASGDLYNNINVTWYATGQQYTGFQSPTTAYFSVVIDADVANNITTHPTAEQIYAYIQAQLRRSVNINAGSDGSTLPGDKIGKVVPDKLRFVGDDLYAVGLSSSFEGVYINDYNEADVNRLHFWGYGSAAVTAATISSISRTTNVVTVNTSAAHGFTTGDLITISGVDTFNGTFSITVSDADTFTYAQTAGDGSGTVSASSLASPAEYTNIQYPYTAILTLNFGQNLQDDADAIYRVFFTNDDAGDNSGFDFGTKDAILVNDADSNPMSGTVSSNASVQLTYDYDGNIQRGAASAATNAPVTAVAIGLGTAQYVIATGTIQRSISNSISLVAPLERNYEPGSV
jgi:hypothetical protein